MFSTKQNPPQTSVSEPYSVEIKIRLSEASLIKLISILLALLLGSGAWTQMQEVQSSIDLSSPPMMSNEQ